jgi:hypothetical protein
MDESDKFFNLDQQERENLRNKKLQNEVSRGDLKENSLKKSLSLRSDKKSLILQRKRVLSESNNGNYSDEVLNFIDFYLGVFFFFLKSEISEKVKLLRHCKTDEIYPLVLSIRKYVSRGFLFRLILFYFFL